MGQYLQAGICHRIILQKEQLKKYELTITDIILRLAKDMDMTLFECNEMDCEFHLVLRESIVLEQLHDFIQNQLSLYHDMGNTHDIDLALETIAYRKTLSEIVDLAKEKQSRYFQNSSVSQYIELSPWQSMRYEVSLFVIIIEGKLIMECYNDFLRYFEHLVRLTSQKWPISGAFRAFIQ